MHISFKSSLLICLDLVVQNIYRKSIPTYRESYTYVYYIVYRDLQGTSLSCHSNFRWFFECSTRSYHSETAWSKFSVIHLPPTLSIAALKIQKATLLSMFLFFHYVTVSYFNILNDILFHIHFFSLWFGWLYFSHSMM